VAVRTVFMFAVVRGGVRIRAISYEGLETVAEHVTQVAFQRLHRGKSVCHLSIINECACVS